MGPKVAAPFDLLQEAKRLIRLDTVTSRSNVDCAVYVGGLMRKLGWKVAYQESQQGPLSFLNVIGAQGSGKAPLLLCTHLDTVDSGERRLWTRTGQDPWKLTVRGGTLYGLGVADTKLDMLCKLLAVSRIDPAKLKRSVLLLGSFGEESGLKGAAHFCQGDFPRPKMALVGEPSELTLVTRHKGLAVLEVFLKSRGLFRPSTRVQAMEVAFRGKASHSATPHLGANAIEEALIFLKGIQRRFGKVHVLSWQGGAGHNIIPEESSLRFCLAAGAKAKTPASSKRKVRTTTLAPGWYPTFPWEQVVLVFETLERLAASYQKSRDQAFDPPLLTWSVNRLDETPGGWRLTFDIRSLPKQNIHRMVQGLEGVLWKQLGPPGSTWTFRLERDNPGLELNAGSALITSGKTALRAAKLPVRVTAKTGCSEAGLFNRLGIPSAVFGPGRSVGNIHRPNEAIALAQLKGAIRFYQAFVERTCS